MADGGNSWTAIGDDSKANFQGTFDGGGHTVSGVCINKNDSTCQGLFGYVSGATIKNVGVVDSNISAKQYVGGIVVLSSMSEE